MSTQVHKLVFNERRGNPHTTGQAAAGPISIHKYSERVATIYSSNIKNNKGENETRIRRPEIPVLGQAQKCGGVKVLWRDHKPPLFKIWSQWKQILHN